MKKAQPDDNMFLDWFRNASPYINAFRGRIFVIAFNGKLLQSRHLPRLIEDIALLNSLGIRLVLVHGIRDQIDKCLAQRKVKCAFMNGVRITDERALSCAREAAGTARITIESLLSMGLANTPLSGSDIKVVSGNFVTARPLGIIHGTDFQHTGKVRRINHKAILECLSNETIVLLSPLGYSPSGECFNLMAHDVATSTAIALQADKLILLTDSAGMRMGRRKLPRELTLSEAEKLAPVTTQPQIELTPLQQACLACQQGVRRAHILNQSVDGAVLRELFTRDGCGCMISADRYEDIQQATADDIGGILKLISPLEEKQILVRRTREALEAGIERFTIVKRDGAIIACSSLHPFPKEKTGEISCLAVHEDYQARGYGQRLLDYLEEEARRSGLESIFVLTTQAVHWFHEHGFQKTKLDSLPLRRRQLYNYRRKSVILIKELWP